MQICNIWDRLRFSQQKVFQKSTVFVSTTPILETGLINTDDESESESEPDPCVLRKQSYGTVYGMGGEDKVNASSGQAQLVAAMILTATTVGRMSL